MILLLTLNVCQTISNISIVDFEQVNVSGVIFQNVLGNVDLPLSLLGEVFQKEFINKAHRL